MSTYASGSQWVHGVTDTGLIRLFPNGAQHRDTPIRSAFTALGHLTLLTVAVGVLTVVGINSTLGSTSLLTSGPVLMGLWTLVGFIGVGIVKTSFRFAGYGLAYMAGLAAAMTVGGSWLDDAVFFGGVYLGFTAVVAVASGVVWFNIKWND